MYKINNYNILIQTKNGSMKPSPYSLLLAQHIPSLTSNSIVLDLGCGSGILGILSYIKGSDNVIMSDISDNAILDTKINCELNKIYNIKL